MIAAQLGPKHSSRLSEEHQVCLYISRECFNGNNIYSSVNTVVIFLTSLLSDQCTKKET